MVVLRNTLAVFVLLAISLTLSESKRAGKDKKGDKRKQTRVNRFGKKISKSTVTEEFEFPEELELDFAIIGEATMRTKSRRVSSLHDMPTYDSRGRKKTRDRRNQQYYVDDNGSYQVSATTGPHGSVETGVKATYRNGKGEKCFYARGESHCWRIDGEGEFRVISRKGDTRESPMEPDVSKRKKRQDGPLIYTDFDPSRIFKVVYVVDKPFMDWFRDLSGNDETAVQDAEDYIIMINNELTYMYRGIKEVSERESNIVDMDIVVYAQGFVYPELGTEWSWLTPYVRNGGILASDRFNNDALSAFGIWVGNGNLNQFAPFDHATFITPSNLVDNGGGAFLGIAYLSTVCDTRRRFTQVSLNWDGFYDVALTAAHELGHALSANHDTGGGQCPDTTYIMAASAFGISTRTEDTWNRWSVCSVREIVNHVRRFSGCLQIGGVSDDAFYDQLCRGVRGSNQFDVNFQCKNAEKVQSSVVCGPSLTVNTGKVPAQACWDDFLISCTDSQGRCNNDVFTIFDGTPCEGLDSSKDYVCYRGDCLEKVNVCAGRNATTMQPGTTNAPVTTDPSTTNPPTTAAPVTNPPTTNVHTTNQPTTNAPTTDAPTTNAPVTNRPTTNVPATNPPTTAAPVTNPPTTIAPTTDAPTTNAPATNRPTTNVPATNPPTTAAPVTNQPTTNAPTTNPPTTNALTTNAPTTNAPATSRPTTNVPVTNPPTTIATTTLLPGTAVPSCECAFSGRRQRRCCRRNRNLDDSCCTGCRRNRRGGCRPQRTGRK